MRCRAPLQDPALCDRLRPNPSEQKRIDMTWSPMTVSAEGELAEPLNEQIYQQLKWRLIVGELPPGTGISIRRLASELGISAMPVREALKRLASERAFTSANKRSFRVPELAKQNISDLFFVRSSLEGIAAELATPRLTQVQIARLRVLAAEMDDDIEREDYSVYLSRNYSFHFTIYTAAGNAELVSITESLWAQTGPFLAAGVRAHGMSPDWQNLHLQIVEAMAARDAGLARNLIEKDINWGTDAFQ